MPDNKIYNPVKVGGIAALFICQDIIAAQCRSEECRTESRLCYGSFVSSVLQIIHIYLVALNGRKQISQL